jgi:hypothetical protein
MNPAGTCSSLKNAEYRPSTPDSRPSDLPEALHLEAHGAIGERGHEVLEGLALDDGDRRPGVRHGVVPCGERRALHLDVSPTEPVGVALPRVDEDLEALGERPGPGDPGCGAWEPARGRSVEGASGSWWLPLGCPKPRSSPWT